MYKIYAKILVDQLFEVVPSLLFGNQEAFTSGGPIGDQLKLAKEMIVGYNRKATPRIFCMSVDFYKTFDTISWKAIDATMESLGFSEELRRILSQCYQTPSFLVLVNGEPTPRFTNQRGLRQGDLLSPILFNLTMENLTLLIDTQTRLHHFHTYKLGGVESISHLLCVDDILIFVQTNDSSMSAIKGSLKTFSYFIGMSINMG